MSGLKRVLTRITENEFKMGGAISDGVIRSLRNYRTQQSVIFAVLFAILVGVVAFGTFGLMWFIKQPNQMALFSGAMGLSVGGAIELMRRIWKEWSQAVLLLILLEDASESQARTLVDKLIKKLK